MPDLAALFGLSLPAGEISVIRRDAREEGDGPRKAGKAVAG